MNNDISDVDPDGVMSNLKFHEWQECPEEPIDGEMWRTFLRCKQCGQRRDEALWRVCTGKMEDVEKSAIKSRPRTKIVIESLESRWGA